MVLLDLPDDVIAIVQLNLQPRDFLSFCRTSKSTYTKYRQDSLYWRIQTADNFRLPVSPLLAADGPRWYWLYKRLRTQTRLYAWGQAVGNSIGHHAPRVLTVRGPRRAVGRVVKESSGWPSEVDVPKEVDVIADLQCGGWSTTILSSRGHLYTVGRINGEDWSGPKDNVQQFTRLEYLTQSLSAVRQFSSGRSHVLGLTDDGEIISWDRVSANGYKIFSHSGIQFGGKPTRVAAGWGESSAYVPETGIVYWTPVRNNQQDVNLDGLHVQEKIMPGTSRSTSDGVLIEVVKHVVLAEFIVWITSDSKLYACSIGGESRSQTEPTTLPFQVPGYTTSGRMLKDLQGQFQTFGVFTAAGEVLSGNTHFLRRCSEFIHNNPSMTESGDFSSLSSLTSSKPADIPALQHTGVIGLAYGDYHYHALHSDGKITSYGRDSECLGQLGLGKAKTTGRFRGMVLSPDGTDNDAFLLPTAELRGRQIWFEPEKREWLEWLDKNIKQNAFASSFNEQENRQSALREWIKQEMRQGAFGEWIEQEGRHWNDGPTHMSADSKSSTSNSTAEHHQDTTDYTHLDPYFVTAIAAAGWHSGALVLVDHDKAQEIRNKWLISNAHHEPQERQHPMPGSFEPSLPDDGFVWESTGPPRVELPDGYETAGQGNPQPWRDGMPSMAELGLAEAPENQTPEQEGNAVVNRPGGSSATRQLRRR